MSRGRCTWVRRHIISPGGREPKLTDGSNPCSGSPCDRPPSLKACHLVGHGRSWSKVRTRTARCAQTWIGFPRSQGRDRPGVASVRLLFIHFETRIYSPVDIHQA
jgi:hypothetical protein